MLQINTNPENKENKSRIQGVQLNILKMFPIAPCVTANLSRNFIFMEIHSSMLL